jgi:hypothetical protein
VVESRFEAESPTFFLKVEETPELWPEESARAKTPVTCHDHVEPMQWRHLNVFNKECVIVCALPRGRRGDDSKVYPCDPAVGGTQQALYPGVGSLCSDPHAGDAGEACWPDPRRERHADVADAFRPRESGE